MNKEPYNDTSNPNVIITEPAPGNFVILGHNPKTRFVEGEGHIVPSQSSEIPQEVPTSALLWILNQRGVSIYAEPTTQPPDGMRFTESSTAAVAPIGEPVRESLGNTMTPAAIEAAVLESLSQNGGTMRIGLLAKAINVSAEEIKFTSGFDQCAYEIASGGWVKLKKTEEAAQ